MHSVNHQHIEQKPFSFPSMQIQKPTKSELACRIASAAIISLGFIAVGASYLASAPIIGAGLITAGIIYATAKGRSMMGANKAVKASEKFNAHKERYARVFVN